MNRFTLFLFLSLISLSAKAQLYTYSENSYCYPADTEGRVIENSEPVDEDKCQELSASPLANVDHSKFIWTSSMEDISCRNSKTRVQVGHAFCISFKFQETYSGRGCFPAAKGKVLPDVFAVKDELCETASTVVNKPEVKVLSADERKIESARSHAIRILSRASYSKLRSAIRKAPIKPVQNSASYCRIYPAYAVNDRKIFICERTLDVLNLNELARTIIHEGIHTLGHAEASTQAMEKQIYLELYGNEFAYDPRPKLGI